VPLIHVSVCVSSTACRVHCPTGSCRLTADTYTHHPHRHRCQNIIVIPLPRYRPAGKQTYGRRRWK
jgi:hypothetical protein